MQIKPQPGHETYNNDLKTKGEDILKGYGKNERPLYEYFLSVFNTRVVIKTDGVSPTLNLTVGKSLVYSRALDFRNLSGFHLLLQRPIYWVCGFFFVWKGSDSWWINKATSRARRHYGCLIKHKNDECKDLKYKALSISTHKPETVIAYSDIIHVPVYLSQYLKHILKHSIAWNFNSSYCSPYILHGSVVRIW